MVKKKNHAEIADRHQKLIIFAIFLMSLIYLSSAVTKLTEGDLRITLGYFEMGFAIISICIIVPIIYWKFRNLTKEERNEYLSPEGYLFSIVKKALSQSWAATFVFMTILAPVSRKLFSEFDLTPHFFIEVVLAFMLGSFSVIFFILDLKGNVDDS